MLCAFCYHTFESHGENLGSHFIAVDKLGVAEHFGLNAEEVMQLFVMHAHLIGKFVRISERRERMGVCFGQEFNAAGGSELLQKVNEFGNILLELFEGGTGD